jgi:hypothetical protein
VKFAPKTTVSILINCLLALAVSLLGFELLMEHLYVELQVTSMSRYAGALQASADFGNGVRRFYRPTPAKDTSAGPTFTGERDRGVEVWSQPFCSVSWMVYLIDQADKTRAEAFADAYNARMRDFIKNPAKYDPHGEAATQSAD